MIAIIHDEITTDIDEQFRMIDLLLFVITYSIISSLKQKIKIKRRKIRSHIKKVSSRLYSLEIGTIFRRIGINDMDTQVGGILGRLFLGFLIQKN